MDNTPILIVLDGKLASGYGARIIDQEFLVGRLTVEREENGVSASPFSCSYHSTQVYGPPQPHSSTSAKLSGTFDPSGNMIARASAKWLGSLPQKLT